MLTLFKPEYVIFTSFFIMLCILLLAGKFPKVQSILDLITALNTKGGNIALLALLTLYFFAVAMRFFYYIVQMIVEKKLTPDNAIVSLAISFVCGTAFGSALGALLKAMSGETFTTATKQPDSGPQVTPIQNP